MEQLGMKTGSIQFLLIKKQNNTTEMVVFIYNKKNASYFGSVFLFNYYFALAAFVFAFTPFLL